jgi:starvation-inducible outer membrane lipoprotein
MKKLITIVTTTLFVIASSTCVQASPVVLEKKFSNCAALNKVYPGGVAKSSKWVNKGGKIKNTPVVNSKVYLENVSRDRDNDGIACEN